MKDFQSKIHLW